jgi:phage-related protein
METLKKPIGWLHGEIKTPPFSLQARIEAGYLLRRLQMGEKLSLPQSRPMPAIGKRCHELRIVDETKTWRIVYRIDNNAILVIEIFEKKTQKTPNEVIQNCKQRLRMYDTT